MPKVITTSIFIEKAIEKHGDRYDYSKVEYINSSTKITISCKIHGEFNQTPNSHLNERGCNQCGIDSTTSKLTKTNDGFIENAINVHRNKYDYSKVDYTTSKIPIIIICKKHGEFNQTPNNHLHGQGCNQCGIDSTASKLTKTTDGFIENANFVHKNKYDYSKVEYTTSKIPIIIICKKHGEFLQTPNDHLNGRGCNQCGIDSMASLLAKTNNEFIHQSLIVHRNKYDYSKVVYVNNSTKITISCKKHGEFNQTPIHHLSGSGCPKCACNRFSKAQIEWLTFIEKFQGIKIQHAMNDGEYKIKKTRWLADGYCKDTNTIFEYHGDYWHGNPTKYDPEFINTVCNKKMKTLYAATLKREQKIRDLGYNLEIMWEFDWNQINKSIKRFQLKYRSINSIN